MEPNASTCSPSPGSNRMRRIRLRNSTARIWAPSSLSVKYAWPEPYTLKLLISPSTQTVGKRSSSATASRRDSSETLQIVRSLRLADGVLTRRSARGLPFGRGQRVLQEHRDGEQAAAAGNGRHAGRALLDRLEVDVAGELAGGQAIDADVDHPRAVLHHATRDHARTAGGHAQHVGATRVLGEVARARVAHRHGRVAREPQLGGRLAPQARAPDDDGLGALELDPVVIEDLETAGGRARHGAALPRQEASEIRGMQAVDVLLGIDGGQR